MSLNRKGDSGNLPLRAKHRGLFLQHKRDLLVLGTGLIALDIVVTDRTAIGPRCWAGGTCGNVLAILAYLGWHACPAATLGEDAAAEHVLQDLRRFGVSTRFLRRSTTRHTPVVIQKIRTRGPGAPRHRFVWTCPNCGAWLPGYQAILASEARDMTKSIPTPAVFFFDKVSRGALELAHACAERGALVMFEPSGVRDERLFKEAIGLSHIVKYSHDRLGHLRNSSIYRPPFLEIETLGGDGLRYRTRNGSKTTSRWKEMGAYPVTNLRDAAGAGDWCTAGILHALGNNGAAGLMDTSVKDIEAALRLGQALAAVKCKFEGARGTMYSLNKRKLEVTVAGILKGNVPSCVEEGPNDSKSGNLLRDFCPNCSSQN